MYDSNKETVSSYTRVSVLSRVEKARGGGYSDIKWVCMSPARLKSRGLRELIKFKKWVLSELIEL